MNSKLVRLFIAVIVLVFAASMSLTAFAQGGGIVRGGTLVLSLGNAAPYVQNFSPFAPDTTDWVQGEIYETLMVYNPVEGGVPTPWLATDYAWSDDLLSLTYTLRDGVLWSDGEAFTADDVVFTFELLQKFPAIDRGALLSFVDSAEKVDDLTVTFHLNRIYTVAPERIGGNLWIVPEHIWKDVEDPVTFTNPDPVGTGMLTEAFVPDDGLYLELCRNENYWQMGEDGEPLPYIDCARHPMYPGNDPANLALISGELDWIGNFIPDIDNVFVAQDPEHYGYYFWPGGGVVALYMNTTKAPYSDVKFRQALSMAIDRQSVTDIGMYGYTDPVSPTGLGPRHASWINPEAEALAADMGLGVYDPDAAAVALDEAGYVDADGDGWRDTPDGEPIKFSIQAVNGWTDWVTSIQIISENFQEVGINADIITPEFGAWMNALQTGDYDVSIGWGTSGNTPWDHFRDTLYSPLIGEDGLANAELWGRWTSDETDALVDAFTATADVDEQHNIVNQLQMTFVENVITIPLFAGPTWYEYVTLRFTGFPTEEDYYTQGSPWHIQGSMIVLTHVHCVSEETCAEAQ